MCVIVIVYVCVCITRHLRFVVFSRMHIILGCSILFSTFQSQVLLKFCPTPGQHEKGESFAFSGFLVEALVASYPNGYFMSFTCLPIAWSC